MDLPIASSPAAPSPAAAGAAAPGPAASAGASPTQQDAGAAADDTPFHAVLAQRLGLAAEGKAPQGPDARTGKAASVLKSDEDGAQAAADADAPATDAVMIPFSPAFAAREPAVAAAGEHAGAAAAGARLSGSTARSASEGGARAAAAMRLQPQRPAQASAAASARSDAPEMQNTADPAATGNPLTAAAEIRRETACADGTAEPPKDATTAAAASGSTGSAAPAQSSAPAAAPVLSARVGEHGWDQALGNRLVWMAGQGQQVAQLHLNPPELGPLHVTLTLNNDQASAQFVSGHALVRDALEAGMPRLREMLADSGIALGNASVSADAFREQAQPQPQQQPRSYAAPAGIAVADPGFDSRGTLPLRAPRGLVDIFA